MGCQRLSGRVVVVVVGRVVVVVVVVVVTGAGGGAGTATRSRTAAPAGRPRLLGEPWSAASPKGVTEPSAAATQ